MLKLPARFIVRLQEWWAIVFVPLTNWCRGKPPATIACRNEQRRVRGKREGAQSPAQTVLSCFCHPVPHCGSIFDLEIEQSDSANSGRRLIGIFVPAG